MFGLGALRRRRSAGATAMSLADARSYGSSPVPDEEMIGLLSAIKAALPQKRSYAVGIISTLAREGTTTIAHSMAQVAARNPRTKVIMCRVTHDGQTAEEANTPFVYLEPIVHPANAYKTGTAPQLPANGTGDRSYPLAQANHGGHGGPMMGALTAPSDLSYIVKSLTSSFDLVVVDLPPVSEGPLGPSLSKGLDGVVVVVEAERTRLPALRATRKSIEMHGGTILGTVLNKRRFYIPNALYRRL
jgi:protein-tyrosine kinase